MANYKKHGPGNWEYRFKYKDPFTKKYREKSERGFKTKDEAETAAADARKKIKQGFGEADVKLADYLTTWLEEYKQGTVRKNTFELHENNIKTHIKPYFKEITLNEVRPEMYQKFLNGLSEKGVYSRRTVELVHSTMHNAMKKAVTLGRIEKNPCVGAEIKGQRKKSEVKFIESDHIPRFLQEARKYGYIYWIFFRVLIETGMRKGEAAALKWSDIDFKNNRIKIDETLDFTADDDEKLFGDTKTLRSERTIKMSQALANDLKYHAQWQNQNKLNLNAIYKHKLNLVLCREDGHFMPKSSLFNAFSRILKRSELPQLPIHSLRHTCAVLLLEAGADMKFVQEQLGHGSIQITSDVYSHISKKLAERNIKKFEEHTEKIWGHFGGKPESSI